MESEMYIFLDSVRFNAFHGVDPQETKVGHTFVVDLKLKVNFVRAAKTDDLSYTVSYADVYQAVKKEMITPSKLLEHVSNRIICRLFREFRLVEEIELKLSKQNPPMGADMHSAGVMMKCKREDVNL